MRLLLWLSIVTYFLLNFISKADFNSSDKTEYKKAPPPADWNGWQSLIDPRLQKSYDNLKKHEQERKDFLRTIKHYTTISPKDVQVAFIIDRYNLFGDDLNSTSFKEDTKWLEIYKREVKIAQDNLDGQAYIFFFEEYVKLLLKRSGIIKIIGQ